MNQKRSVEGLFEIVRARQQQTAAATHRFILISRGGRLFGAAPNGHVYWGRLQVEQKRAMPRSILRGTYEIPARRFPVRRAMIRRSSIRLPITGEIDPLARSQNATVSIGRRKIDIKITYLGPLPP